MDYEKLKDRAGKTFDGYELFFLKEKLKKYETKDAQLCGVEIKEEEGIALRGIKDKRLVFSYTYDRGDSAIEALIENGVTLLPYVEEDENAGFSEEYKDYPSMSIYDSKGLEIDDMYKVDILIGMEKAIIDFDKKIVVTRNCELQEAEIQVKIINSNGLNAESRKTLYMLSAMAVAKDKDEVSWYDWIWSNRLNEIDARTFGTHTAQKTISFLSSEQIETGAYDGILSPQASSDILGILSDSFLSENLYKDKTMLKDRRETKCFSEIINIKDSGMHGMDSFPFDGEGVPSFENIVVENGYFNTFLYDNYYGRKYNLPSTGNCERGGVKEPPRCATRGFFIEKGMRDIKDELTNGLIIEELMGTHTANTVTGDFSLGAIGYLCKNGSKKPFKGVIISGNIFEMLNNVKEIGNDLRFYGTCGSPSLYIEGLKISGK
ncbi:MAG: TldD/PmbA family protein [Proteobacteria bacterium]|nr:TldD/PmbA family protein [Pseudomonadota bacterium]